MTYRIAINGFGRIGRCVARILAERDPSELQLVAINDLTEPATLAHLLRYDSNHGRFGHPVEPVEGGLRIAGRQVRVLAEPDPAKLPWKELEVDLVLECTGRFRKREQAQAHLQAGARRVLISAPGSGVDATFCYGINHAQYDPRRHTIVSNASCTTNCLAPVVHVLHRRWGLRKGHMVTVHAYTNDQRILDLPHKDLRRARAAALSMIPTSTGAARAIGLVLPELAGRLDGTAIRVPTPNVSLVCLTALLEQGASLEAVADAYREAACGELRGVLAVSEEPLVSVDFGGDPHSAIVDLPQLQLVQDELLKVQAWYDNEWGFSNRMVDMALHMARCEG